MMRIRVAAVLMFALTAVSPITYALEKQPAEVYHARRVALAAKLQGGIAVLFALPESELDFTPYRQDSDFYYLTGWTEPGAALLIVADSSQLPAASAYKEVLYLPTRDLQMEKYTGPKMNAATPGATKVAGVEAVAPMTELPAEVNRLINGSGMQRPLAKNIWLQPDFADARALLSFTAISLGMSPAPEPHDVTALTAELRLVKDAGEVALIRKATAASIQAQLAMMRYAKPGRNERAIAGQMTAVWMENGCERPSYAPIVGTGTDSTILHYSANDRTIEDGDILLVDAACEYSMYAADITRTVPANGRFTQRQRDIYNIVLGAQRAAIEAFVAGKSTLNDRDRHDPNSLDTVAYNYINTHGKALDGGPLGKYWLHGLGHMMGIDVHDPAKYPALLKPGMVFTIEPGIYIPEEKLGVRIECDFLVGADGKMIDLDAELPHTADEVETAIRQR